MAESATTWPEFFEKINNITLKVTPGCNLKCVYCNVEAATPKTPKMDIATFKQICDLAIENSKSPFVGLEFHGGEPLLLPDEWFAEAVPYAKAKAKKHNKYVDLPIMTNATMLTEKRLENLLPLGVRICMSCDGPPSINDELRGGGQRVKKAFEALRERKLSKGVITVLSQSNWNRMPEVMDWFADIGVNNFMINFLQPQGRGIASDLLSGEQMFAAMRDIFEHMESSGVAISEAEVASRMDRFVRGRDKPPRLACHELQCQAGKSYIAIDNVGTVHPCGSDVSQHKIGHLDSPFDPGQVDTVLAKLHDKGIWKTRCFGCNAKQICNHSCPTTDHNSNEFKEHDCLSTKLLWDFFCENSDRVHELHRIHERRRRDIFNPNGNA